MSVFKFTDAVRVGWKAAKRPSCRYTSCQLPAIARSWLRRFVFGQLDSMVNKRSTNPLPGKRARCRTFLDDEYWTRRLPATINRLSAFRRPSVR